MGFRVVDERTFEVGGDVQVWLHDMVLERADGGPADLDKLKPALEAAFIVVMRGVAENDGYNALVMAAGLGWRDVALIRTVSRFLRQIRVPYSQDYMWATLRKHAALATKIVELFHARFDPHASGKAKQGETIAASARRPSSPRSKRPWARSTASTKTASCGVSSTRCSRRSAPTTISSTRTASRSRKSPSSFPAASSTVCRSRCRSTKSLSIRRASRPCTCASARWRAAASAGPTVRRTSAPKSSAS